MRSPLGSEAITYRNKMLGPGHCSVAKTPTPEGGGAKGRTGDCPGPRKETTTRRHVTQGGCVGEGQTPRFVHLKSAFHFGPLWQMSILPEEHLSDVGGWGGRPPLGRALNDPPPAPTNDLHPQKRATPQQMWHWTPAGLRTPRPALAPPLSSRGRGALRRSTNGPLVPLPTPHNPGHSGGDVRALLPLPP